MTNKEAIKHLTTYAFYTFDSIPTDVYNAINTAIRSLKERPIGIWTFCQGTTTQGSLKCPFCDYRDYHNSNYNFCPNCGADMRGNKHDN